MVYPHDFRLTEKELIAPEYFDKLEPCLEAVCNEIDQWPPPVPGQTLNLPVMGVVIQVRIPSRVDKPGSSPVKQFNQEEHYLASLMPLQRAITPWKNPPQIRPFCQEDFMKSLEHAGPQLTCVLRGDWLGLYRRFFKSPNFDGWFRQRHREMTHKLEALHLEAICEADIVAWMKDKSEVEIVDLVLKLREKLVRARCQHLPVKEETLQRVGLYIDTVIGSLPEDLQAVLHHP
ncbi:hypothetical protein WISP_60497 [Willisornis vidua]|uniref:DEN6B protein n=1 Tax=Willisornis vidua TaxID=1566151 RepID=A0ABQ9DGH0_9PASS|nr:hypothetical protein WISP_60497 [Willisornis vidua]